MSSQITFEFTVILDSSNFRTFSRKTVPDWATFSHDLKERFDHVLPSTDAPLTLTYTDDHDIDHSVSGEADWLSAWDDICKHYIDKEEPLSLTLIAPSPPRSRSLSRPGTRPGTPIAPTADSAALSDDEASVPQPEENPHADDNPAEEEMDEAMPSAFVPISETAHRRATLIATASSEALAVPPAPPSESGSDVNLVIVSKEEAIAAESDWRRSKSMDVGVDEFVPEARSRSSDAGSATEALNNALNDDLRSPESPPTNIEFAPTTDGFAKAVETSLPSDDNTDEEDPDDTKSVKSVKSTKSARSRSHSRKQSLKRSETIESELDMIGSVAALRTYAENKAAPPANLSDTESNHTVQGNEDSGRKTTSRKSTASRFSIRVETEIEPEPAAGERSFLGSPNPVIFASPTHTDNAAPPSALPRERGAADFFEDIRPKERKHKNHKEGHREDRHEREEHRHRHHREHNDEEEQVRSHSREHREHHKAKSERKHRDRKNVEPAPAPAPKKFTNVHTDSESELEPEVVLPLPPKHTHKNTSPQSTGNTHSTQPLFSQDSRSSGPSPPEMEFRRHRFEDTSNIRVSKTKDHRSPFPDPPKSSRRDIPKSSRREVPQEMRVPQLVTLQERPSRREERPSRHEERLSRHELLRQELVRQEIPRQALPPRQGLPPVRSTVSASNRNAGQGTPLPGGILSPSQLLVQLRETLATEPSFFYSLKGLLAEHTERNELRMASKQAERREAKHPSTFPPPRSALDAYRAQPSPPQQMAPIGSFPIYDGYSQPPVPSIYGLPPSFGYAQPPPFPSYPGPHRPVQQMRGPPISQMRPSTRTRPPTQTRREPLMSMGFRYGSPSVAKRDSSDWVNEPAETDTITDSDSEPEIYSRPKPRYYQDYYGRPRLQKSSSRKDLRAAASSARPRIPDTYEYPFRRPEPNPYKLPKEFKKEQKKESVKESSRPRETPSTMPASLNALPTRVPDLSDLPPSIRVISPTTVGTNGYQSPDYFLSKSSESRPASAKPRSVGKTSLTAPKEPIRRFSKWDRRPLFTVQHNKLGRSRSKSPGPSRSRRQAHPPPYDEATRPRDIPPVPTINISKMDVKPISFVQTAAEVASQALNALKKTSLDFASSRPISLPTVEKSSPKKEASSRGVPVESLKNRFSSKFDEVPSRRHTHGDTLGQYNSDGELRKARGGKEDKASSLRRSDKDRRFSDDELLRKMAGGGSHTVKSPFVYPKTGVASFDFDDFAN